MKIANFPVLVTATAEQYNKHGDCSSFYIVKLNGSNWEVFPNESDHNCGYSATLGIIYFSNWIVSYKINERLVGVNVITNDEYLELINNSSFDKIQTKFNELL